MKCLAFACSPAWVLMQQPLFPLMFYDGVSHDENHKIFILWVPPHDKVLGVSVREVVSLGFESWVSELEQPNQKEIEKDSYSSKLISWIYMRRQTGGSQPVSHINNSLGRSQIGLKAKSMGGGATLSCHRLREVARFSSLASHNPDIHKHASSFLTWKWCHPSFLTHQLDYINPLQCVDQQEAA